ncbi:MAG: YeeE/YedE family protein [Rhodobacteraceae bacterium]|nr:YeeE/YedE family protein [Paracoccaceae bacterium]
METEFTPLASLIGGGMIGAAAVLLMGLHGRIMGATGVLRGVLSPVGPRDWSWRVALLVGMASAPLLYVLATGRAPDIEVPVSIGALVVGGVLVGFGVTLGGGCTSGHGVCGMARFSRRSLLATLTFMATCLATVFISRHIIGV